MSGLPHRDSRGLPVPAASTDPIPGNGRGYTHQSSYNDQPPSATVSGPSNDYGGSIPPGPDSRVRGNAQDGSHSAVFGLTPDGHRHMDTSPSPTPPQQASAANLGTQDLSSVSGMTSSSSNTTATPGEKLHIPPRGTAVRGSSDYAPETISGNVEHVPTQRQVGQAEPGTNLTTATTAEDPVSPVTDSSGLKKQGTLSKLFKRKPVAGPDAGMSGTPAPVGEERKKYY